MSTEVQHPFEGDSPERRARILGGLGPSVRDAAPTCPFHDDRAQVRNGMCGDCAEKADDAR